MMWNEIIEDWRKLYNEEIYGPVVFVRYNSNVQIKEDYMTYACSTNEYTNVSGLLVSRSEEKRPLHRNKPS
jgi:hypothetical protein